MTLKEDQMFNEKTDEAFKQAKHQLEIEGFTVTKEDEQDMKAVFSGKMTREKLIDKLKNQ